MNNLRSSSTIIDKKLKFNQFSTLPETIVNLQNLQFLNLSPNKLNTLPNAIVNLQMLKRLWVDDNQLTHPPQEIAQQGIDAIRYYFAEALQNNQIDYLYELKLLLVGEGRVGKTSLAKSLTNPNYQLEYEQSTEGIDIHTWIIPKEGFGDNPEITNDVRLNIWDFGGQEIYHATHQFFLTKRSLYVLVTESRKEDRHEDFYYWLNIIQLLGDRSPVLIVLNKCDEPIKELPISEYKERFETIVHPYPQRISCQPTFRHTIEELKAEIGRIITNKELLPHLGTPLPKVWVAIREVLESVHSEGKDFISRQEYLAICGHYGMNEENADFLSDYLHDIGVIIYFRRALDLHDLVVLNPEWITDGVYKVLDNEQVKTQKGEFNDDDLMHIWRDNKYRERRRELLALMRNRKFDLCYDLPNGGYLAPQLLPVDKINTDKFWRNHQQNLRFEYRYKFMPKGMLTRFIVKRHYDIYRDDDIQVHWRYGVLLDYEETHALVQEQYLENKITIVLDGPNQKRFFDIIRKTMQEIHNSFHNLVIDEMIPCNCIECVNSQKPHFFKHEFLEHCLRRNRRTWSCEKSLQEVNLAVLLNDAVYSGQGNALPNNRKIRHVLSQLYPAENDIRRVMADAGLDTSRIIWGASVSNQWQAALTEAEHSGRMQSLMDVVMAEYGDNPALKAAYGIMH
ncbi:MAG: COR domain-containing protein [Chloroflexota bacterium]